MGGGVHKGEPVFEGVADQSGWAGPSGGEVRLKIAGLTEQRMDLLCVHLVCEGDDHHQVRTMAHTPQLSLSIQSGLPLVCS